MDGVDVTVDPEEMDPRTYTAYEEVLAALDGDEELLHTALEAAAEETLEANLDSMYDQREGQLKEVLRQGLGQQR
jgi:hypothetical protein